MNDRYLFKAKRKDWREFPKEKWWVQGYLFDNGFSGNTRYFLGGLIIQECKSGVCEGWYVAGTDFYEIDPSTLCQCTGLKDKNGNLIWENDVVVTPREDGHSLICWNDTEARWEMYNNTEGIVLDFDNYWSNEIEVCGNKFDNPELLEVE